MVRADGRTMAMREISSPSQLGASFKTPFQRQQARFEDTGSQGDDRSTSPTYNAGAPEQVPEHARGDIRIECDLASRHLTICECRPLWREDFGPEWTRSPLARLHYTKNTGLWTL